MAIPSKKLHSWSNDDLDYVRQKIGITGRITAERVTQALGACATGNPDGKDRERLLKCVRRRLGLIV